MTDDEVARFFEILQSYAPHPQGELLSSNTFTLLVAVVLSAQCTDKSVNKATKDLFQIADTPEKMLALGEEKLKDFIKTLSFYNAKSRNIMGLSRKILEIYKGDVPCARDHLLSLPGVGRKTANVVLNIAFDQPTLAVDTHVFRVSNRTGLAFGKTPDQVEEALLTRIPEPFLKNAHHWLILHGRYLCQARRPSCHICPVKEYCHYPNKQ